MASASSTEDALLAQWPQRHHICLGCRMLRVDDRPCECGSGEVVSLETREGRNKLVEQVWGGWSVSGFNSLAQGMAMAAAVCLLFTAVMGSVVGSAISVGALVLSIVVWKGRLAHASFQTRVRKRPLGAPQYRLRLPPAATSIGVVRQGNAVPSPIRWRACVAYMVQFETGRAEGEGVSAGVTMRDAMTTGFEMVTDDGTRIRVPPGHIEILTRKRPPPLPDAAVERYQKLEHPRFLDAERYDPFEHQRAVEVVIQLGDRVELFNPLVGRLDPTALPTSYRESAATVSEPAGVPIVRLLS